MREKIGLTTTCIDDEQLIARLLDLLKQHDMDYTFFFRMLIDELESSNEDKSSCRVKL